MKRTIYIFSILAILAGMAGCATSPAQTEQLLSQAGFRCFAANSDAKMQHLMSLPPDKLTIARINGKPFYVFPDPQHKRLFVGGDYEFQNYQQILSYRQLNADSHVLAVEDHGPGDDAAKWVAWTSDTGWTHGTY